MARQVGTKITGTLDELTFYQINGNFYVRKKPQLNRKKYLHHPSYKKLRDNNNIFKKAVRITSYLHGLLPAEERRFGAFAKITGWVIKRLQEGLTEDDIYQLIIDKYAGENNTANTV